MEVGMCTCYVGFNGAPCKHQYAIIKHFGVLSINFLPISDEKMRLELLYLATGQTKVSEGWFVPLSAGHSKETQRPDDMSAVEHHNMQHESMEITVSTDVEHSNIDHNCQALEAQVTKLTQRSHPEDEK